MVFGKGAFLKFKDDVVLNYLRFEAGGAHGPHPPPPSPKERGSKIEHYIRILFACVLPAVVGLRVLKYL